MEYKNVPQEIFNKVNENVKALEQLFPSAVKDGEVDFIALKEALGQFEEVDKEKYEITWAGKQDAKKESDDDVLGRTLKFISEESEDADITGNIYIEGENLEVLQLLRQNYYNSIKMIYIDPPYNTGKDFIYKDKYSMTKADSEEIEGEAFGEERFIINQKSHNRFHANWLSMMYARIKVSKDLLSNDGVIFISIDDNELDNLKRICDEVFGEENFLNLISVASKVSAGASGGGEDKRLKKNIEYVLIYVKNLSSIPPFNPIYEHTELMDFIEIMKMENKSFKYTNVLYKKEGIEYFKTIKDGDGNDIEIYKVNDYEIKTIKQIAKMEGLTEKEVYYKYYDKVMTTTNAQTSIRDRVWQATDSESNMYAAYYVPRSGKNKGKRIELLLYGKQKVLIIWLKDTTDVINEMVYKKERIGTYWDGLSWINVTKEGNLKFPNGKKPISLIKRMMELMETDNEYYVLDFFSGSASTAHAVLDLNSEDKGKRKFILVQYPEHIKPDTKDKKEYIEYLKEEGVKPIISEIGKERIRRSARSILEKQGAEKEDIDLGFKVFKTSDTNIRWTYEALESGQIKADEAELADKDLLDFMPGFTDLDVVYEILLRQRDIPLSSKVEKLTDIGDRTFMFAYSYVVCLEETVTEELVGKLAALEPLPIKFIFRDSAFEDDISLKDETFRRLQLLIARNTGDEKKTYTVEFL